MRYLCSIAGGATVGALASAAMAWRSSDYGYYQRLMAGAAQVYALSLKNVARLALSIALPSCKTHALVLLGLSNLSYHQWPLWYLAFSLHDEVKIPANLASELYVGVLEVAVDRCVYPVG